MEDGQWSGKHGGLRGFDLMFMGRNSCQKQLQLRVSVGWCLLWPKKHGHWDRSSVINGFTEGHQEKFASFLKLPTKNVHRIAQLMRNDFVMFIFILFISRMKVTVTTETWILFMKVGWKGAVVSYNVSQCVTMSIDCLGFLPGSSWHALPPSVKSYPLQKNRCTQTAWERLLGVWTWYDNPFFRENDDDFLGSILIFDERCTAQDWCSMALHDARDGQIWEYQQLQGFQRHFRFLSSSFADDCVMFMGAYLFVYLLGSRIGMLAACIFQHINAPRRWSKWGQAMNQHVSFSLFTCAEPLALETHQHALWVSTAGIFWSLTTLKYGRQLCLVHHEDSSDRSTGNFPRNHRISMQRPAFPAFCSPLSIFFFDCHFFLGGVKNWWFKRLLLKAFFFSWLTWRHAPLISAEAWSCPVAPSSRRASATWSPSKATQRMSKPRWTPWSTRLHGTWVAGPLKKLQSFLP